MTTIETGTIERDYAGHDEAMELIAQYEVEQAAAEAERHQQLEVRRQAFLAERAIWQVINGGM